MFDELMSIKMKEGTWLLTYGDEYILMVSVDWCGAVEEIQHNKKVILKNLRYYGMEDCLDELLMSSHGEYNLYFMNA